MTRYEDRCYEEFSDLNAKVSIPLRGIGLGTYNSKAERLKVGGDVSIPLRGIGLGTLPFSTHLPAKI
jgi:hypothetical protein